MSIILGCFSQDFSKEEHPVLIAIEQPSEEANSSGSGPSNEDQVEPVHQAEDFELLSEFSCASPCLFRATGGGPVVKVVYKADDWVIGESRDRDSHFSVEYDFQYGGVRSIQAYAYNLEEDLLGSDQMSVDVVLNQVSLQTQSCEQQCLLKAQVSGDVYQVDFYADDYFLGVAWPPNYELEYTFSQTGSRDIDLLGFSSDGELLVQERSVVDVREAQGGVPNVPYFYQFANSYSPGSTCANTSIAMLLAYYGWSGAPDELTSYYGVSTAQSPSGLASVFNQDAAYFGLSERLLPTTSGTLTELRTELDAGRPVIVHGYFTAAGHVLVVLGYDQNGYWVNDPAGTWNQYFQGGYPYGWEPTAGKSIYYGKTAFELAITSTNGYNYEPIWMHFVR